MKAHEPHSTSASGADVPRSDDTSIGVEHFDGWVCLTIDRPWAMNALDSATKEGLARRIEELERDDAVRVIVLTGAGERSFCSGADLREVASLPQTEMLSMLRTEQRLYEVVRTCAVPVIAAVKGYALGTGCLLALVSDLCIAQTDAVFGFPEVGMGAAVGLHAAMLPSVVGLARARRLILLGETMTGPEAEAVGLASRCVPSEAFAATVEATVHTLLRTDRRTLQVQKRIIKRWIDTTTLEAIAEGTDLAAGHIGSEEHRRRARTVINGD